MKKLNSFTKVVLTISLALGLMGIVELPIDQNEFLYEGPTFFRFLIAFGTWSMVFGMNDVADRLFVKIPKLPAHLLSFSMVLVTSIGIMFVENYTLKAPSSMGPLDPILWNQNVYSGCWLAIITRSFKVAFDYIERNKQIAIANEKLIQANTKSHLALLNQQVNPHFLFNSLNTLLELVGKDNKPAISFVKEFSAVYRYVLDFGTKDLVTLSEELEFIRSYLFVLEERFGDKLRVNIEIPKKVTVLRIPPLTLQNLVENAIKHNEISTSHPLTVDISVQHGLLIVRNQIRPKGDVPESGLGLRNLRSRIQYLLGTNLQYEEIDSNFQVSIPLVSL